MIVAAYNLIINHNVDLLHPFLKKYKTHQKLLANRKTFPNQNEPNKFPT